MSSDSSKVLVHISNKRAYIWNPDDVYSLRAKHRITGTLVGTLPSISQQNVFLGLPLLLLPEEVVLLVENGVALLLDDSSAHRSPTSSELKEWHANRIRSAREQDIALLTTLKPGSREARQKGVSSESAAKKRAERDARKKQTVAAVVASAAQENEGIGLFAPELDDRSVSATRSSTPDVTDGAALPVHTVHVPSESASLSWYNPTTYDSISSASKAGVWTYPSTIEERAKCAVFRDLWEKGYYMGGGLKFGGDWLVYPGDPLRYHSHFVATIYPKPTSSLRPIDIVALGRLGTATKKAHLLCGWDEGTNIVDYYSIEWAGFG